MNDRPDIVWIYCDQLRCDALESYGNPSLDLHTPNLDRLAAEGTRFTNCFCNSPVCVPSRMCSLTGMYPEESAVYGNEAGWRSFRLPRLPDTLPEVLVRHGYQTANFGKIHVARGMYPGEMPGRDIFQIHDGDGCTMKFWQVYSDRIQGLLGSALAGLWPDELPYPPDIPIRRTLEWMEKARSPCFTRLSILQPHVPVLPPARYMARLKGQVPPRLELPESGLSKFEQLAVRPRAGRPAFSQENLVAAQLSYHAQVAWIDDQVGRVLDWLEERNRRSRTVVVFHADHGVYLAEYGLLAVKHTFAPFVHRVPLIVSGPGPLPRGTVRDDLCDSLDVTRTLLALAGAEAPRQFHGRNLFGDPPAEAVYSTIGYGYPSSCRAPNGGVGRWDNDRGWPRRSCIRAGYYRLDMNMRQDGCPVDEAGRDVFLADTRSDPMEQTNLANDPQYGVVVRDLCERLTRHAEGSVEVPYECVDRRA